MKNGSGRVGRKRILLLGFLPLRWKSWIGKDDRSVVVNIVNPGSSQNVKGTGTPGSMISFAKQIIKANAMLLHPVNLELKSHS